MNSQDFVEFGLQIAIMLLCALVFGQIMRRFKQPAVLGEMIGGILLGPTLLGWLLPEFYFWLFQSSPNVTIIRDASIKLGMLFFLFIAGLEVNLSDLRRVGKKAILIGSIGTVLPIVFGVGLVYAMPRGFWGSSVEAHFFSFALFIGMNFANSANPVIARVLMDLDLLKGQLGTLIMTATIVDDLVNWSLFAIILSDIAPDTSRLSGNFLLTGGFVVLFIIGVLGIGRAVGSRTLHWVRTHLAWPVGFITITALFVLVASSISEGLGINAFLGAFLVGAALGGSGQEKNEAHDVISYFVLSFFAPIYFVSMGMTSNFVTNFNLDMVIIIVAAAFISKIGAVLLGAKAAGMPINRETLAVSFGLNARGATGIILASVGLANHIITDQIYVAIVLMAIITSIISGPAIKTFLKGQKTTEAVESRLVFPNDN
jgi:Kef-type K+ transport system membrane component KefB